MLAKMNVFKAITLGEKPELNCSETKDGVLIKHQSEDSLGPLCWLVGLTHKKNQLVSS